MARAMEFAPVVFELSGLIISAGSGSVKEQIANHNGSLYGTSYPEEERNHDEIE